MIVNGCKSSLMSLVMPDVDRKITHQETRDHVWFWWKMNRFPRASVMTMSELRLSEDSASGWKAKMIKKALLSFPENRLFLEPLGNACLKWLPMLYYKGSGLKGLWSPSGIETQHFPSYFAGIVV
jgi:hypothetical protein